MTDLAIAEKHTQHDVEQSLVLKSEQMYSLTERVERAKAGISVTEAGGSGFLPPHLSGHTPDDSLPSTPAREMHTGLLPPADEVQISFQKLQNKNSQSEIIRRLLIADELTLADTKGYRIRAAYRLIRQHLRIRGLLVGWARIQPILDQCPYNDGVSYWYAPTRLADTLYSTGYRGVRNILLEAESSADLYTVNTERGYKSRKGSTILPPPIPDKLLGAKSPAEIWALRLSRRVPESYSPEFDHSLCLFCEAMSLLAYQMCLHKGAAEEPWSGVYGLAGLLNPYAARISWPTRDELVLYEEELMLHVFDRLTVQSELATQRYMQQFFGYTRFEAVDIVKSANEAGGILYNEEAENQRAVLLKRLDAAMDRSVDACDIRAELASIKLKSQLLGLTANEENESMQTLRDAALKALKPPTEDIDV